MNMNCKIFWHQVNPTANLTETDQVCFLKKHNQQGRELFFTSKKIKEGVKKAKNHVGNINNYFLDRQGFLTYMKKLPSGSKVIWRYLAIKFHVKNKSGQFPKNAGQVLMTFATQNEYRPV